MRFGVGIAIILVILAASINGVAAYGGKNVKYVQGYFTDNIFNNGRIKFVINENNSKIFTADGKKILVSKFYPELQIKIGNKWITPIFKKHMYIHNSNGWHHVTIFMDNTTNNGTLSLTLTYSQKHRFVKFAPLYPHIELYSTINVTYRIVWHIDDIHTKHFVIINNKTKEIIYNNTIHSDLKFKRDQDIMIGFHKHKKMFGLNWEICKSMLNILMFVSNSNGKIGALLISRPYTSEPQSVNDLPYPIPDSGGGGGIYQDSDGDGLYDEEETIGWTAYWYDHSGLYHTTHVISSPYTVDTDGDGVSDYEEWINDLNPQKVDTDGDGMSDYYELHYGKPAGGWQEPHWYNARYAVIIVGGGWNDPKEVDYNTYLPAFWNDGKAMYDKLVNDYHYSPNYVYLMSSRWYCKYDGSWAWRGHNTSTDAIVDGEAMWNVPDKFDIMDALDEIASTITVHDSLFITITAHGGAYNESAGSFSIRAGISNSEAENSPASQNYVINCDYTTSPNLGSYLNTHFGGNNGIPRKYAIMIIVIQSCHSGSFIPNLIGNNRIVITAAEWNEESFTEMGSYYAHWAFLYEGAIQIYAVTVSTYPGFISGLGTLSDPNSIYAAYKKGLDAANNNYGAIVVIIGGVPFEIIVADGRSTPKINNSALAQEVYL